MRVEQDDDGLLRRMACPSCGDEFTVGISRKELRDGGPPFMHFACRSMVIWNGEELLCYQQAVDAVRGRG